MQTGATAWQLLTRFKRPRKICLPSAALCLAVFFLLVVVRKPSDVHILPDASVLNSPPREYAKPPSEFVFSPSLDALPPRRNAVITSLFVAESDLHLKRFKDAAWFFTGAYVHTYTFLKKEKTQIAANEDIEFVVMVTKLVPRGYRLALEDLGARVLEVPPIEIPGREKPGDKYQYLYTKLNMFRLEGIYDKVLFFDVDLFFLRDSPIDLFDWIPENATYFFGSTSEWKKGYGAFNSGIQLFKPSHFHYSELIEKARDPNFAGYGDQSLHNHYWVKDGPFPWTELPQKYNTHHLYDRNTQEIADGIGFHGKLWSECHLLNNASAPLFQLFAETAQAIRNLQMRKYETGESDTETVIMPAVPSACLYWNSFTKRKGGMFKKLVIVSMDTTPKSILKTRQEFGEIFSQANHVVMKRDERDGGKASLVLRQLRMAKELFERYDFVWMLDDAVSMKGMSNSTILYDLHDHTHLTTFADCVNQKGENATASFLISKMAENKLDRVLSQYAEDKNAIAVSSSAVWEHLSKEFTRAGGKRSLRVNGTGEYYSVERSDTVCERLLKSEIYGEKA